METEGGRLFNKATHPIVRYLIGSVPFNRYLATGEHPSDKHRWTVDMIHETLDVMKKHSVEYSGTVYRSGEEKYTVVQPLKNVLSCTTDHDYAKHYAKGDVWTLRLHKVRVFKMSTVLDIARVSLKQEALIGREHEIVILPGVKIVRAGSRLLDVYPE